MKKSDLIKYVREVVLSEVNSSLSSKLQCLQ